MTPQINTSRELEKGGERVLNPVRMSALGLTKADNKAEALGLVKPPREQVLARLRTLRDHRWSSYRAYGNYGKTQPWLFTEEILRRAGGQAAYRKYVQQYVTHVPHLFRAR